MARKLESDGVIGMLRRLFGHEEDRKLLHKFAQKYPLKAHRVNPMRGYVFKPSVECDNLIKNMVALDAVFNSQDFVCDLAMGKVNPKRIEAEIGHAKSRLEKKLRAYSYWANRLVALESLLKDKPSLETFALEDRLLADSGSPEGEEEPYALRAVQLLEKVEEQGRRSLLSANRLADKAWALHRLELYDQAEHSARQALDVDPAHSEAWMLLAILSIRERQSAQREVTYYQFQREEADPVSSHERWAEEMQDMAEAKVASALEKHRKIVFPALLYWPRDPASPISAIDTVKAMSGLETGVSIGCLGLCSHKPGRCPAMPTGLATHASMSPCSPGKMTHRSITSAGHLVQAMPTVSRPKSAKWPS